MTGQHLEHLLSTSPDIKRKCEALEREHGVKAIYFWDEARLPHLGEGELVQYIILGVSTGAGIAATSLIKAFFEKAGEAAWHSMVNLFKHAAKKLHRKRMFFFVESPCENTKITLLLDNRTLSDETRLRESYSLYGRLIQLAQSKDEFVTDYCKTSLLIKYDNRCGDFMIYPVSFDIENDTPTMLTSRYDWVFADDPDAKSYAKLDNLFLLKAIYHRSFSEYRDAIEYFEKALQSNPKNMNAWLEMGATYFRQGGFSKAIDCWKRIEEGSAILPSGQDITDIYLAYAHLLLREGNVEQSAAALKLGLTHLPETSLANVYVEYSRVLIEQGKLQEAANTLEEGLQRVSTLSKGFDSLNSEYQRMLKLK